MPPTRRPRADEAGLIRVLVVDDHPTVRTAIRHLLESTNGMVAAGEATNGRDALRLAETVPHDVVLMDYSMPIMSGVEATRRLTSAHPDARVLMFSAAVGPDVVRAAQEAGALGFLPKGSRAAKLVRAIQAVSAGQVVWPAWGVARSPNA